jgi:hypothetical protein
MYRTCLFCHRDLGRNDVVEALPIGRRLAFDAARGRLWVVCAGCDRWNLTPLDERWEAIEVCERAFRATPVRVATDQIALARLAEGLELVRIGAPVRPEFAAWRYGAEFGMRRRRDVRLTRGGGLAALGAAFFGGAVFGIAALAAVGVAEYALWRAAGGRHASETVVRIPGFGVAGLPLWRAHLDWVRLRDEGAGPALVIAQRDELASVSGPAALRALGLVLAYVNRAGASSGMTQLAAEQIATAGDGSAFLARFAAHTADGQALTSLLAIDRLALEMAVHEAEERAAFEGDLAALERAWRDAEALATVADDLAVPAAVRAALGRLRAARTGAAPRVD